MYHRHKLLELMKQVAVLSTYFMLVYLLILLSSETSVDFQRTTRWRVGKETFAIKLVYVWRVSTLLFT
jgi:hypothetical protein